MWSSAASEAIGVTVSFLGRWRNVAKGSSMFVVGNSLSSITGYFSKQFGAMAGSNSGTQKQNFIAE